MRKEREMLKKLEKTGESKRHHRRLDRYINSYLWFTGYELIKIIININKR